MLRFALINFLHRHLVIHPGNFRPEPLHFLIVFLRSFPPRQGNISEKELCADVPALALQAPLFFILFADYGGDDNNVRISSKRFHTLLRKLDESHGVGLHPSLSSNKHVSRLKSEYTGLSRVLNRDVTMSRQHFLKLSMPRTYRALDHLTIRDDYSMGYASHPGFRAGIAIPFPFFDLSRNEATSLMIHPVTLMDVTMKDHLRLSPEESLETIRKMIQKTRAVNGEFVSLWHNESLGETDRWRGWRNVFEEMVKIASA